MRSSSLLASSLQRSTEGNALRQTEMSTQGKVFWAEVRQHLGSEEPEADSF